MLRSEPQYPIRFTSTSTSSAPKPAGAVTPYAVLPGASIRSAREPGAFSGRPVVLASGKTREDKMNNALVSIVAAGLAAWIFGWIWYGVLGKAYQRALGKDPQAREGRKMPLTPLAVCLVAELVMAAVVYQILTNLALLGGALHGAVAGLTLGIGLPLMAIIVNNAFQQRNRLVTVIDGLHWVLVLVIEGAVIGAFLA